MPSFLDQLGRSVQLPKEPQRIISLVPSQTELLFDLGLKDQVIGITKFCVHPKHQLRANTIIGGTKQLNLQKINGLQPDLIIANKEENVRDQVQELARHFPVWISDVNNLEDALQMINSVGEMVNRISRATKMIEQIKDRFSQLQTSDFKRDTCYLIWKDPYMTVGGDTFINDMMARSGFDNIFSGENRYPSISEERLRALHCDLLLLSSEPYPFKEKHIGELQRIMPKTKIVSADGEMFSWYGSRLLKAPYYFKQLQNQVLSLNHARGTE